jgi:hypothetical protein
MPKRKAPPQQTMIALLTGHWIAQMLFAVVKLGVPDALARKRSLQTRSLRASGRMPDTCAACCVRSRASACSAKTRAGASG